MKRRNPRSDVRVFGVRRRGDLSTLDDATARMVIKQHAGLVGLVIRRMNPPARYDRDELVHLGRLALVQAWVTHDTTQSQFSTWAVRIIRQAFLDFFMERAQPWDLDGDDALTRVPADLAEPEDELADADARAWLRRKLANGILDERERAIMRARLAGDGLAEVGRQIGVSRERVRQIEAIVIDKLKEAARIEAKVRARKAAQRRYESVCARVVAAPTP